MPVFVNESDLERKTWSTPYIVDDNFLTSDDCNLALDYIKSFTIYDENDPEFKPFQIKQNFFAKDQYKNSFQSGIVKSLLSVNETEFAKDFYSKYSDKFLNYQNLLGRKDVLDDYKILHIGFTSCKPDWGIPNHIDDYIKLTSSIVYLNVDDSGGTRFYSDEHGNDETIVRWKQNRIVAFNHGEKDGTRNAWHTWISKGWRYTVLFNLLRGIEEAERLH